MLGTNDSRGDHAAERVLHVVAAILVGLGTWRVLALMHDVVPIAAVLGGALAALVYLRRAPASADTMVAAAATAAMLIPNAAVLPLPLPPG